MSDNIKELLELAALACRYKVYDASHPELGIKILVGDDVRIWAPHLDDSDGAWMEAELSLMLVWQKDHVACWHRFYEGEQLIEFVHDAQYADHNGNRQAARRMASLRVAAELGRRMK